MVGILATIELSMKNTLTLIPLIICFSLLTGYNFMSAQWSAPTAAAPGDNTEAPVNVGSTTQAKSGSLAANIFAATTEMRSNRYCDALGGNCFTATSTVGSAIGVGQTWQNVRPNRTVNTTFRNTTGRPILVSIVSGGNNETIRVSADNVNWVVVGVAGNYYAGNAAFVVPNNHYYRVDGNPYAGIPYWSELR